MNMSSTAERPVPGIMPDIIFNGVIARYILATKLVNGMSGCKILDVGCGTGIGSGFLAKQEFAVTGIDVDSESINWGKLNKLHPNLVLLQGQGERLPFDSKTFDAVIAFECIEHMDSPYTFVLESKRVLKPRGIMICSVPYCIGDIMAELLHGGSNPYHIQRFTPETMRYLLSICYTIEEEWGQNFHQIDYYTYTFVKHFIRRKIKCVPFIGEILLNRRRARIERFELARSKSDIKHQMNYDNWREDRILPEWMPKPIGSEKNRIPETLIFLARRS